MFNSLSSENRYFSSLMKSRSDYEIRGNTIALQLFKYSLGKIQFMLLITRASIGKTIFEIYFFFINLKIFNSLKNFCSLLLNIFITKRLLELF